MTKKVTLYFETSPIYRIYDMVKGHTWNIESLNRSAAEEKHAVGPWLRPMLFWLQVLLRKPTTWLCLLYGLCEFLSHLHFQSLKASVGTEKALEFLTLELVLTSQRNYIPGCITQCVIVKCWRNVTANQLNKSTMGRPELVFHMRRASGEHLTLPPFGRKYR